MKSILDIPDGAVLAVANLEDLIGEFAERLKIDKPDAVCLPVIDFGGANYASSLLDRNVGPWSRFELLALIDEIQNKYKCEFIAAIQPALPFLDVPVVRTRNQYGDETAGPCLSNPAIQKLLQACIDEFYHLAESRGLKVDGFMLDIVDIHGMSGRSGRVNISCFCKHCNEGLSKLGKFDYQLFTKYPSPINLALKDTGTGIANFTMDLGRVDPGHIIELSKDRDIFDERLIPDEVTASKWANILIEYLEARSRVTAQALETIGSAARNHGMKFIVTTGNSTFDWTAGIDLWHITNKVADAVWLDTGDVARGELPVGVEIYHYLSARARYRVDAFFEIVSDTDKLRALAARFTDSKRSPLDEATNRSLQMLAASQLKRANVSALTLQGLGTGYVGFPVTEALIRKIMSVTERLIEELAPNSASSQEASGRDVLLLLMNVAQSGRQIDMQLLTQIAERLGLFAPEA